MGMWFRVDWFYEINKNTYELDFAVFETMIYKYTNFGHYVIIK